MLIDPDVTGERAMNECLVWALDLLETMRREVRNMRLSVQ
jgi:hypothetical protein